MSRFIALTTVLAFSAALSFCGGCGPAMASEMVVTAPAERPAIRIWRVTTHVSESEQSAINVEALYAVDVASPVSRDIASCEVGNPERTPAGSYLLVTRRGGRVPGFALRSDGNRYWLVDAEGKTVLAAVDFAEKRAVSEGGAMPAWATSAGGWELASWRPR